MKTEKLNATTQKSYYGKAVVIYTDDGALELKSYDTIVCRIEPNPETGELEFVRLWGGYSRTTMNHVNDFRRLWYFPALSKREWDALPCENRERYKVEFSNGFVNWTAAVVFDDENSAWEFAEKVQAERGDNVFADVVSA